MALMCALGSSNITRLQSTWSFVSRKAIGLLEELERAVEVSRNYAALRQMQAKAITPCLPFVGLYLTDLNFANVGNANFRSVRPNANAVETINVINFDKWTRLANILEDFQRFQVAYQLQDVPKLQAWLSQEMERVRGRNLDVHVLYEQSLLIEPKTQILRTGSTATTQMSRQTSSEGSQLGRLGSVQIQSGPAKQRSLRKLTWTNRH